MLTENPIIDIPLIPSPKQQRQGRLNACTPASAAWADDKTMLEFEKISSNHRGSVLHLIYPLSQALSNKDRDV